jgi:hypothetical protein
MKIKNYEVFDYLEVFKVTEFRAGTIYDAVSTGKYIHSKDAKFLPMNYIARSVSTKLLQQTEIEIEIFELTAGKD